MKYSHKISILLLITCFIVVCNPPTSVQDKDDTDINGYADETFFKVDGRKHFHTGQAGVKIGYQQRQIPIRERNHVEAAVVTSRPPAPTRLGHDVQQRCPRGVRRSRASSLKH